MRRDLPIAQQLVQAVHAATEAGAAFNPPTNLSVVVCAADSEKHLEGILAELSFRDIDYVAFREPDIGDSLTAIATRPLDDSERKRLSKHKLWSFV